jgi:hypothetical protein
MAKRNGKTPTVSRASMLSTTPEETEHECSIAALMERSPETYAKCVKFIEEGHSPGGVAALCGVSIATVRKIRSIIGEPAIHAGIRSVGRNLVEAAQAMSERLVEEGDEIPIHLLPQALAVTVDRASLLSGGVTQRIEHKNVPTPEDLLAMFDALPKAKVTEVGSEETKPLLPPAAVRKPGVKADIATVFSPRSDKS